MRATLSRDSAYKQHYPSETSFLGAETDSNIRLCNRRRQKTSSVLCTRPYRPTQSEKVITMPVCPLRRVLHDTAVSVVMETRSHLDVAISLWKSTIELVSGRAEDRFPGRETQYYVCLRRKPSTDPHPTSEPCTWTVLTRSMRISRTRTMLRKTQRKTS